MEISMKTKMTSALVIAMLLCNLISGQEPQFSQFYSAPLYLNPALTGNTIEGRIGGNFRKQWLGVPGAFTSYSFFYDHNLSNINSGVGLLIIRDQAGSGGLSFTNIGGLYSYKMALNRNLFLNVGVRAAYVSHSLIFDALRFGDQILRDNDPTSLESFANRAVSYFDMSMGYVFYSTDYWVGMAFDHLTRPNQSFMGFNTQVPIKYSIHGGYVLPIKTSDAGDVTRSLTITSIYKAQEEWDQVDVGSYVSFDAFLAGVWYRGIPWLKAYKKGYSNNDALTLMIGYKVEDYLSIGYSYDITISRLGLASKGSHEVSIIYEYTRSSNKRDQRRKQFMVPCAKFSKMPYAITPAKKKTKTKTKTQKTKTKKTKTKKVKKKIVPKL